MALHLDGQSVLTITVNPVVAIPTVKLKAHRDQERRPTLEFNVNRLTDKKKAHGFVYLLLNVPATC